MAYTTAWIIAKGKEQGWYIKSDDPYGLFCGLAGRAWGWAQLDTQKENVSVIGYDDVWKDLPVTGDFVGSFEEIF